MIFTRKKSTLSEKKFRSFEAVKVVLSLKQCNYRNSEFMFRVIT